MPSFAHVVGHTPGALDGLLAEVAARLTAEGASLAGVVQSNTATADDTRCDMNLTVLGRGEVVRISQRLGAGATGCRLDPQGLEQAVGLVEASMPGAGLLIVNKFGKAEIEGRGFRPLIGRALAQGSAVLVGMNADNVAAFAGFHAGLSQRLPGEVSALLAWCRARITA